MGFGLGWRSVKQAREGCIFAAASTVFLYPRLLSYGSSKSGGGGLTTSPSLSHTGSSVPVPGDHVALVLVVRVARPCHGSLTRERSSLVASQLALFRLVASSLRRLLDLFGWI